MSEEINNGSGSVDVISADLTTVVESVSELTEVLQAQQEQKTAEEEIAVEDEKNTNELLKEVITTLKEQQPTEEEVQAQTLTEEEQATTDDMILQELTSLNENLLVLTEQMPEEKIVVEGFYFVGLSVVITFAVYMFWSQLSKW